MRLSVKRFVLYAFLLIGVNLAVFYPSFFQAARADQIVFLTETASMDHLPKLLSYTYSYCRTRVLLGGDIILFRPALYFFLSLQKWLFGLHFTYWQVTAFVLHIAVVLLLLRLLLRIADHPLALLTALHFSLLYISMDMVTWHHISGYLLFCVFLLWILDLYATYVEGGMRDHRYLWGMVGCLTVACFLYEYGILCALVLAAALWGRQRFRSARPALLLIPVGVYVYFSAMDFLLRFSPRALLSGAGHASSGIHPFLVVKGIFDLTCASLAAPFMPGFFYLVPTERTQVAAFYWKNILHPFAIPDPVFRLNSLLLVLIGAFFVVMAVGLARARFAPAVPPESGEEHNRAAAGTALVKVSLALAAAYILMLVFGRVAERSMTYMINSLYHFYFPCLFFHLAGYGLFMRLMRRSTMRRALPVLLALVLGLSMVLNGVKVYQLNIESRAKYAPWSRYIGRLQDFVDEHRGEKDFSFNLVRTGYRRWFEAWVGRRPWTRTVKGYAADLLFRQYINTVHPKYYLVYTNRRGLKSFPTLGAAKAYLARMGIRQLPQTVASNKKLKRTAH